MAKNTSKRASAIILVCGENEFAVAERAKHIYQEWCEQVGGFDHEIIDGTVAKAEEALKVISRVREALFTLPFFGSAKVIWLRQCNFLGTERVATAQIATDALSALAHELEQFDWSRPGNVKLLISATDIDRRRTFTKVIDKIGRIEIFSGWSLDDKNWEKQAEEFVKQQVSAHKKQITDEALAGLINRVGPDQWLLNNEIQKLVLYVGDRPKIQAQDVEAVCIRNKHARAFALADALGARDLSRLLRCLDEELWEMQFDKEKSEFGLLSGLVAKIRAMIFAKEMLRAGWLKRTQSFEDFRRLLENVPQERLPLDHRFNPLAVHPYVLFKAVQQSDKYSLDELIRAMDLLLQCNQKLIYSDLDARFLLQQTMIEIASPSLGKA